MSNVFLPLVTLQHRAMAGNRAEIMYVARTRIYDGAVS